MNLIKYAPRQYDPLDPIEEQQILDALVISNRAARCARIDALTVKRRNVISECKLETPPEAHAVEEWLQRQRAVDDTPRLAVLKAILRLRL